MNGLGDLESQQTHRTDHGIPSGDDIFITPPPHADLPADQEFLRELGKENIYNLLRNLAKMNIWTRKAPYLEPPYNHVPVDIMETKTIAAGATATVLTYTAPVRQIGIIDSYSQEAIITPPGIGLVAWADLLWSFKINNAPMEYFNGFAGQRGKVYWPRKATFYLNEGQEFSISVQNNAALNSYDVTAAVRGWQYMKPK